MSSCKQPIIIAGPCVAESYGLLDEVASSLCESLPYNENFYFKASFDKANRSHSDSYRGPGIDTALQWFSDIKEKYSCRILTDIHEAYQAKKVAEVCDGLQIPAFLCRQTDLLHAAIETGRFVNIKKGQFMSPNAMRNTLSKAGSVDRSALKIAFTERGSSFGYGDLVVDMRSLKIMAETNTPVLFDITHSTQQPQFSQGQKTSGARRDMAPLLSRCAAASGYLSGFFLEIHPRPTEAKSDAGAQLTIEQGISLLTQVSNIWQQSNQWVELDQSFGPSL